MNQNNVNTITTAIGETMRVAVEIGKHPLMKALLNHYAAFVEAQTGKPAAETIAEINAASEAEMGDFREETIAALTKAIKGSDEK